MELEIIIADRRPQLLQIWSQVFQQEVGAQVVCLGPEELSSLSTVDVELMPTTLAHNRFGGKPEVGKSQVLSTSGHFLVGPEWVVTTPPIPAHFEQVEVSTGRFEVVLIKDLALSPEEETYFVFSRVFECLAQFEANGGAPGTRVLGLSLELLNSPQGEPRSEALAVLRAYREARGFAGR